MNLVSDFLAQRGLLNPAWKRVLGYELEELRSGPFFEFAHPDDVANQGLGDHWTVVANNLPLIYSVRFE